MKNQKLLFCLYTDEESRLVLSTPDKDYFLSYFELLKLKADVQRTLDGYKKLVADEVSK